MQPKEFQPKRIENRKKLSKKKIGTVVQKCKRSAKGSKQVAFPNSISTCSSINTCKYLQSLTCPKKTCMHSTRDLRETQSKEQSQSRNKNIFKKKKTNIWNLQIVSRVHMWWCYWQNNKGAKQLLSHPRFVHTLICCPGSCCHTKHNF